MRPDGQFGGHPLDDKNLIASVGRYEFCTLCQREEVTTEIEPQEAIPIGHGLFNMDVLIKLQCGHTRKTQMKLG